MTIIVLALDALDAGLVEHFNLNSLKLNSHSQIETFSHMQDEPYTPEVWASVATGLPPEKHGVTDEGVSRWDNPVVDLASRFTGHLPLSMRIKLGTIVGNITNSEYTVGETNANSIFNDDGRVVHNWPGVINGEELASIWHIMFDEPENTDADFERKMYGKAAGKFAWGEEMLRHNVTLAGVHIHVLDALGHAYAENEEKIQKSYEWTADWVNKIQKSLTPEDDLVILSDHGMVTTFYSAEGDRGQDPAVHSWRAYAASTFDDVPESVFEVRDWLEPKIDDYSNKSEKLELPEDQLRQLGYIE